MKHVLKVRDDFYKKDLEVGDEVSEFGGRLKVVDLSFENEYGTFILCEYTEKEEGRNSWVCRKGVEPSSKHPYEIVGTIHIPGYRNMLGGIGFYVKNIATDETIGMSFIQAWSLIFHEGARNAHVSSSHLGNFKTRLMDSIEGLPSFDSHYWKIPAYNSEGTPFAPMTKEALAQLKKGMENAVGGLVREHIQTRGMFDFEDLSDLSKIRPTSKMVVLTGAGMSTDSGIPDYRTTVESMWRKNPKRLAMLNEEMFTGDPQKFWSALYDLIEETLRPITPFPTHEALLATIRSIQPNAGHRFFSRLSEPDVTIITQNIDGLDRKAGSSKVIEMHGNIHEVVCPSCNGMYFLLDVLEKHKVPVCHCGDVLRPNVVFFGDEVRGYAEARKAVEQAELILVVGTSLQVSPFNQLIYAKIPKAKVVFINGSPIGHAIEYDYTLYGNISKILYKLEEFWSKNC